MIIYIVKVNSVCILQRMHYRSFLLGQFIPFDLMVQFLTATALLLWVLQLFAQATQNLSFLKLTILRTPSPSLRKDGQESNQFQRRRHFLFVFTVDFIFFVHSSEHQTGDGLF